MSYVRNGEPATAQPPVEVKQTTGAGPLTTAAPSPTPPYAPTAGALKTGMRSRIERIGYWIIVLAALGVVLLLLGVFLPRFVGAMITGFYAGLFVSVLTMMNLPRPAGWGNIVLGRKVFPVLRAPESDIWRLASVNGFLMFVFTFVFEMIASFVGGFFGGLIVFAALIAAAIFYNRVRSVIIKP